MSLKLYNTLTKQKEEFKPLEGNEVRIYSCGPTVYSFAHIGNFRAYIFMDNLRRVLQANGYTLKHVMNITDVGHLESDADEGEDKMEKAAKKENKDPYEIAAFYTDIFFRDMGRLNIQRPEIIAKATDHIKDMIEFVKVLVEKGYVYETSRALYFDISKLDKYPVLSNRNLDDQIAGARVDVDPEKKNPYDFAVWIKAPENHIMKWESPWGLSYPGWHLECSAMGKKYLGKEFDITGLSSGEKQLFLRALSLKFLDVNNSVILIDEPEISLHPQWQRKIIDVYKSIGENNQLIIATHSPHIVGSVKSENLRVMTKDTDGIKIINNDNLSETYGKNIGDILCTTMELDSLRNEDITDKLNKAYDLLSKNLYNTDEFKDVFNYLRKYLGDADKDIMRIRLEISIREKRNAANEEKGSMEC